MLIAIRRICFFATVVPLSIILLTLAGCNDAGKGSNDFRFGVIVPLTGSAGNYGKSARQGIDLAIKEINAAGGISNRQIAAIYEDSKAIGKDAASATQKLISVDNVSVIIGGIVSAETLSGAPICEQNKVVWLSPTSSAPAITNAGDYIFRNWPSDNIEGSKMADFMYQKKAIKKVAILQVRNDYGEGIIKVFKDRFNGQGGQVTAEDKYDQNETMFRSILTKVLASKPEALYCIGYYTDVALISKQVRELNNSLPIFATTTIEDPQFIKIGGAAVEGVIYPLASGYNAESTDPVVQTFKKNFHAAYNEDPGFVAAQCYDCVNIIKKSIEAGKGESGTEIKSEIYKIKNFQGTTGITSFDQNGDVVKEIKFKVVRNGKFENL